jgi:hypothetical protein
MKIWIHKVGKWYRYFKPKWLNITKEKHEPKIYRWLFWGFYFNHK